MARGKKTGGRTEGVRNRVSRDAVAEAKQTGELPADILLRVARDAAKDYDAFKADHSLEKTLAAAADVDSLKLALALAKARLNMRDHVISCAEAAAPYFNHRLATVNMNIRGKVVVARRKVTSGKTRPPIKKAAAELVIEAVVAPKPRGKRDPRAKAAGPAVRVKKRRPNV